MAQQRASHDVIFWFDIEATTSDPSTASPLEVGACITSAHDLSSRERFSSAVTQPQVVLDTMSDWARRMFERVDDKMPTASDAPSALVDECRDASRSMSIVAIDAAIADMLDRHADGNLVCPAGSSVHFDVAMSRRWLPRVFARLHYRIIDVSTVLQLTRMWAPHVTCAQPPNRSTHRVMADIESSIRLACYYRHALFAHRAQLPPPTRTRGVKSGVTLPQDKKKKPTAVADTTAKTTVLLASTAKNTQLCRNTRSRESVVPKRPSSRTGSGNRNKHRPTTSSAAAAECVTLAIA